MSAKEAADRIRQLEEENARLRERRAARFSVKVSQKGAIQLDLGQRRWPIVLYKTEMEILMAHKDEIEQFIRDNQHRLSVKAE